MSRDSKGRAWYGKVYRRLETILVDVDSFVSQGKVSLESNDSVKDEPEEPMEGEKLSDSVLIDDKFEELCDDDQTAGTSLCHKDPISSPASQSMTVITCNDDTFVSPSGISTGVPNLIPFATEIQATPVQDSVANTRSFSSNSMKVNQDEFCIEDFDVGPLDTIDLYDMTTREDPSDFDDNLLYATRDRTKQLRSFKRKIMDALTTKKRREKEYEQLAIWFGDADMGCDLVNTKEHANAKEHATTSPDSKSSQSNVPFVSEDSEWEIL
ncbi:PREDICTED: uncharacterized protein LOC104740475 [Camelina sativa]|uniref:Uncharacterized protein LOC104740475 n=1 Tax=Camelina sativa TaxID=90675 RepID=A0ABM0VPU2_CAMSA|nr:PREDICTED: uncharacterized protein LOC104740475 [Camelina sativa]XP_010459382.1 PREDICTED: uncharacterized protein LOC104740475 [Camelina sativa]XP_010459383.1 PREDICTED: uncharacterized protein LOC104740475 [Camelina sativa]XP_010459384.1 PREDICTED: uncharacterized protein LOC104740475 [Camelina sativa]XP_010459385.1 PREDICTED: uncharacterized protein LOC104740475 [Camelina sativa]XP_010459387.1 PREDICTED: uncharacterized protein LOC104740475 [Camelina sativa]XP_010459388.1 PREDICTED: unc